MLVSWWSYPDAVSFWSLVVFFSAVTWELVVLFSMVTLLVSSFLLQGLTIELFTLSHGVWWALQDTFLLCSDNWLAVFLLQGLTKRFHLVWSFLVLFTGTVYEDTSMRLKVSTYAFLQCR